MSIDHYRYTVIGHYSSHILKTSREIRGMEMKSRESLLGAALK